MLKNTQQHYGFMAKSLHWLSAIFIPLQFALGVWMVELDYYDSWYNSAPHIHKSLGILFALLILFRLFWRYYSPVPKPITSHSLIEQHAAKSVHFMIYMIIFSVIITGYLISTADGRAIEVFNWLSIPSLGAFFAEQEDVAGEIHEWLAYGLIILASLHALAALKHHFVDKDDTLKRITTLGE